MENYEAHFCVIYKIQDRPLFMPDNGRHYSGAVALLGFC